MFERQIIRQALQRARASITITDSVRYSQQIITRIQNLPKYQHAQRIGIYMPIHHEVDVRGLMQDTQKQFFLPRLNHNHKTMVFLPYAEPLVKNKFGILEPACSDLFMQMTVVLDALVVPMVGFNRHCDRLGMGQGYYDRFLSKSVIPLGGIIGVAYGLQQDDRILAEDHDIPMDCVITESNVYFSED